MRRITWIALVATLAGCSSGPDQEAMRCGALPDIPSYSRCIEIYNARVAREERQSNSDNAAILLLGATAFSNGYTQPRPALTCWNYGPMVQCQ